MRCGPGAGYTEGEVYWGANFATHTHSLLSRKGTSFFLLVVSRHRGNSVTDRQLLYIENNML